MYTVKNVKGINNKKIFFPPTTFPFPEATITNNSCIAFQKLDVSIQA